MGKWRKQKEPLLKTPKKSRKSFRGPKCGKYPEIENKLLEYVTELRKNGIGVSHEMMYYKAREIAASMGIGEFKVHRGWALHFMRRKGLSLRRRTSICQRMPQVIICLCNCS